MVVRNDNREVLASTLRSCIHPEFKVLLRLREVLPPRLSVPSRFAMTVPLRGHALQGAQASPGDALLPGPSSNRIDPFRMVARPTTNPSGSRERISPADAARLSAPAIDARPRCNMLVS
jgi:hypothetical protein